MKKILSLTLAVMLLVSAIPTAFAADQDYSLGTAVVVEGAGGEYTVTVPATLTPGQTGTVTAKGYWASGETLKVTAPETIEVTNTETNQKATVNVDFDGIESLGDDLAEMNIPVSISIDKGNTKFGTWTGTIVYNVELIKPMVTFYVDGTKYQAENGMTWWDFFRSDLEGVGDFKSYYDEMQTADGKYILLNGERVYNKSIIVKNGQYTIEGVNLITFTIDGTEYQAEEGMHLRQWATSEYNTGGYIVNQGTAYVESADNKSIYYNGELVRGDHDIVANGEYTLS